MMKHSPLLLKGTDEQAVNSNVMQPEATNVDIR
jgi:hypothetical protein